MYVLMNLGSFQLLFLQIHFLFLPPSFYPSLHPSFPSSIFLSLRDSRMGHFAEDHQFPMLYSFISR